MQNPRRPILLEPGCDRFDPYPRIVEKADVQRDPRTDGTEPWIAPDGALGQKVEPARHGRQSTAGQFVGPVLDDEVRALGDVSGGHEVTQRLVDETLGLEPLRGSAVQPGHEFGFATVQLRTQKLTEQVVISIPVP